MSIMALPHTTALDHYLDSLFIFTTQLRANPDRRVARIGYCAVSSAIESIWHTYEQQQLHPVPAWYGTENDF